MTEPTTRHVDIQYEDLVLDVLEEGNDVPDRTGVGTRSLFGRTLRYDLSNGFPRMTSRYIPMKPAKAELLWMLSGDTSVKTLQGQGVHIWDSWADENGELGPVYGAQMRRWTAVDGTIHDQVADLVEGIKKNPHSRRHVVSMWNVGELGQMALAPCHVLYQVHVANNKLSVQVYQRSADLMLGVPSDIISYALLTHMLAQQTGYEPDELIWVGGDCHIYQNHLEQARAITDAKVYPFPDLRLEKAPNIFSYSMDMIDASSGYESGPRISMPVAV